MMRRGQESDRVRGVEGGSCAKKGGEFSSRAISLPKSRDMMATCK